MASARDLVQAILKGIQHSEGDVVVVMDADLSHSPYDIPRLLKPILQNDYDMAIGSRYVKGGDISNWDKHRGLSSRISAAIMYPIFGVRDANSGFFAFQKSVSRRCQITRNFLEDDDGSTGKIQCQKDRDTD